MKIWRRAYNGWSEIWRPDPILYEFGAYIVLGTDAAWANKESWLPYPSFTPTSNVMLALWTPQTWLLFAGGCSLFGIISLIFQWKLGRVIAGFCALALWMIMAVWFCLFPYKSLIAMWAVVKFLFFVWIAGRNLGAYYNYLKGEEVNGD